MNDNQRVVLISEPEYTPTSEELDERNYVFALFELSHFVVKYGWRRVEEDLKALAFRLEEDARMPLEPTEIAG
jgi:hypothetical protein